MIHTPEPARLALPLVGGMSPAWAAIESLSRGLSAELGQYGLRTICLRTTGLPETPAYDGVVGLHARALGIAPEQFQATIEGMTHRRRPRRWLARRCRRPSPRLRGAMTEHRQTAVDAD
jgi:NAD(P)-dependent dehydrogenase (short-subunit alcohol dehydrogenase family)